MKLTVRNVAKFFLVRTVEVVIVILLIVFMPSLPPNVNFTSYKVTPSLPLTGKLELNERLNGVEHLYENNIKGPEAFADYNGELYTTIHGGDVVKLVGDHIVPVVKFGKPCKGFHEEEICGRPLGINFDQNGMLYVSDAYKGIWKVNIKTGEKTQLISMDKEIEGKKPVLPNSLAVSKSGDIYWTDSSTEFGLQDGIFSMLADGSGRLIHYNPITKLNTVLIDGLQFANGVVLSDDEEFVIVAETGKSRIHRYYLKGPKKGTTDIFIDGLPGLPDNLKNDGKDGFLVPLVFARDSSHPAIFQVIGPFPYIRKFAARILGLAELGFQMIEKIYPNFYSQSAVHIIGHFEYTTFLAPSRVTVIHLSKDGKVLDSLHGMDRSTLGISEAHVFKDSLYLGSPFNSYVGKISLKKAGIEHLGKYKAQQKVPETPKPVPTQAPKITTPKPTAAPTKKTPPPPTAAPVKQTQPPPTAAPVKHTPPPPTAAPVKQTPPTAAPVKQTPPPAKHTPPTAAPVKQSPPPTKQTPPPVKTEAPVKKETAAPVKQTPPPPKPTTPPPKQTTPPPKQTPPPVKQTQPTPAPTKQAPTQPPKKPTPTAAPVKQTPPPKETPPVVPVKDKVKPKSESIPPRK